jgi:hypothetical protein
MEISNVLIDSFDAKFGYGAFIVWDVNSGGGYWFDVT